MGRAVGGTSRKVDGTDCVGVGYGNEVMELRM
jgi:hypothetical protein